MSSLSLLLLLLALSLLTITTTLSFPSPSSPEPDRFIKSIPSSLRQKKPQEYIELTNPLPSDNLTPSCSLLIFHHFFGDTIGRPPTSVPYPPPFYSSCPPTWSHAVLELRVSSKGEQYDRIAAVWLSGVEILRTSTAEPTNSGVFWKVRKDVTRYSSLLRLPNQTLTVMLENVLNDVYTGVYDVTLTLLFYELGFESQKFGQNLAITNGVNSMVKANSYETPSDLIIPISNVIEEGFWFRIESQSGVHTRELKIPLNTRKAILEIYVSFHGDDEFWYLNPPDTYIRMNNLTTGRGHGAYREVFVTIDGSFIGSIVPFPVIFTGGINPLFWEPIVSIGAFNVPSYDFDLTPFLGLLLDGKNHMFGVGVAESIPFWLVDANLHLWLDHGSSSVQANVVRSFAPALSIHRVSRFVQLDGSFKIRAKRKSRFSGWVKSSSGNFTTSVLQHFNFRNSIRFDKNGTYKLLMQTVKTRTEVRVESEMGGLISRSMVRRKYPLRVITSTVPGLETDAYMMVTNVSHALKENASYGALSSYLHNSQESQGWMVVKDHSVLSGSAITNQSFSSRDEFGCYSRIASAINGTLDRDDSTFSCASSV